MYYNVTYRKAYDVTAFESTGVLCAYGIAQAKQRASMAIPVGYTVIKVSKRDGIDPTKQASMLMRKVEQIADALGYDIDNDTQWQEANALLVAFDMGERLLDHETKQEVYRCVAAVNKRIFPEYNVIIEYAKGL